MIKTLKGKAALVFAAVVGIVALTAGTAVALTTFSTGTYTDRQYFATNDSPWVHPGGTAWVDVPGMIRTVSVPSGTSRLVNARYTAESQCGGSGWCSVRVVYRNSAGTTVELYPQSGTDYAFDSPGGGTWEGNALERNSRSFLPAGTYTVRVQAARVAGSPTFRLDDMHLAVELVRP